MPEGERVPLTSDAERSLPHARRIIRRWNNAPVRTHTYRGLSAASAQRQDAPSHAQRRARANTQW